MVGGNGKSKKAKKLAKGKSEKHIGFFLDNRVSIAFKGTESSFTL